MDEKKTQYFPMIFATTHLMRHHAGQIGRALLWNCIIFSLLCCVPAKAGAPKGALDQLKAFHASQSAGETAEAARMARQLLDDGSLSKRDMPMEIALKTKLVLADALANDGDSGRAAAAYEQAIQDYINDAGRMEPALVSVLARQAELFRQSGDLESAAYAIQDAIQIVESAHGAKHSSLKSLLDAQALIIKQIAIRNQEKCGAPDILFDLSTGRCLQERNFSEAPFALEQLPRIDKQRADVAVEQGADWEPGPASGTGKAPNRILVPVFYGTNRKPTGKSDPHAFFGSRRSGLSLGVATVSVPTERSIGDIPQPTVLKLEFRPDSNKHFLIDRVFQMKGMGEFEKALSQRLANSTRREALIFIHGYNNDFADAVLRAAQLGVDIGIDGITALYSWPSAGGIFSYLSDGSQLIDPIVSDLQRFLSVVATTKNVDDVYIIAHSMGSRYLLSSLEKILSADKKERLFKEIIFAAPDVDADDFASRVQRIRTLAERSTLYVSSADWALKLSKYMNGDYRRAGDADDPLVLSDIETIDITKVTQTSLGHNDAFGSALSDLRAVIWHSLQPGARCILAPRSSAAGTYWSMSGGQDESRCQIETFDQALKLKRYLSSDEARKWIEKWKASLSPEDLDRGSRLEHLYERIR